MNKVVNIHTGEEGVLIFKDGIMFVETRNRFGPAQYVPYSELVWNREDNVNDYKVYPLSMIMEIAYGADSLLLDLLCINRTSSGSWNGLDREKKRLWIEAGVKPVLHEYPEYADIRLKLHEKIMEALEPIWKEK